MLDKRIKAKQYQAQHGLKWRLGYLIKDISVINSQRKAIENRLWLRNEKSDQWVVKTNYSHPSIFELKKQKRIKLMVKEKTCEINSVKPFAISKLL